MGTASVATTDKKAHLPSGKNDEPRRETAKKRDVMKATSQTEANQSVGTSEVVTGRSSVLRSSTSKISSKGQLTLPADVRERLGVKAGDQVEFVFENGGVAVRPVRTGDPFAEWVGSAKRKFGSDEAVLEWIADMRGHNEEGA